MSRGPAAEAIKDRAPRHAYTESRETATLRLGNADGSLASTSRFRRTPDGWDLVTTTRCLGADGGILAPAEHPDRLGRHGPTPYPADELVERPDRPVFVDGRVSYDVAGLERHRSMWVAMCGKADRAGRGPIPGLCLVGGTPTLSSTQSVGTVRQPVDVTDVFLDPNDSDGLTQPWGMWVVADPGRAVLGVHATTHGGQRVDAVRRRGPGWTMQVYVVLARKADVAGITVRTAEGSRSYPKDAID